MLIQRVHSQHPLAEQGLKLCEKKLYAIYLIQTKIKLKISSAIDSIDILDSSIK